MRHSTVLNEPHVRGQIVRVFGDVDLAAAPEFERALEVRDDEPALVIVDLRECAYMDSTGLRILIKRRKAIGARLRLVIAENSFVQRLLHTAGLDGYFAISFATDAALVVGVPHEGAG